MCNELKPCPFCGSSLDIFFEDSYKARLGCYCAELRCFRCGASIHGYGNTKEVSEEHARYRWNTRVERTCHLERIPYEPGEYEGMRCSVCKTVDLEMGVGPYCPGCGAKVVE